MFLGYNAASSSPCLDNKSILATFHCHVYMNYVGRQLLILSFVVLAMSAFISVIIFIVIMFIVMYTHSNTQKPDIWEL